MSTAALQTGNMHQMKFIRSNWPLLAALGLIILVSYIGELIAPNYPKWLFVSGSFIVLTLGRYWVSAMLGQRLTIDYKVINIKGIRYAALRNADYTNILELKVFFELYENNDPDNRSDVLTLVRAESIALSSISAVVGNFESHTVYIALPEKINEIWDKKVESKSDVFLRLGVTSVHYFTGYRDLKTQDLVL